MSNPPAEPTSTPAPACPRRPGPLPARLDEAQRAAFLSLLADGKGVDQAVRALGVTHRAYLNTRRADPEFASEAKSCRRIPEQVLDGHAIDRILRWDGRQSMQLLFMLWRRRDRAHYLNLARRDRARERAQDRRDRLRWERLERRIRFRAERDALVRALDKQVRELQAEVDRLRDLHVDAYIDRQVDAQIARSRLLDRQVDAQIARSRQGERLLDRQVDAQIERLRLVELPRLDDGNLEQLRGLPSPRLAEADLDHLRATALPRLDGTALGDLEAMIPTQLDEGDFSRYRALATEIHPWSSSHDHLAQVRVLAAPAAEPPPTVIDLPPTSTTVDP